MYVYILLRGFIEAVFCTPARHARRPLSVNESTFVIVMMVILVQNMYNAFSVSGKRCQSLLLLYEGNLTCLGGIMSIRVAAFAMLADVCSTDHGL